MGILSWILMGLIVGVLAKFIMPGDDPGGIIVTILIGIAGAFVGGGVCNAGPPVAVFQQVLVSVVPLVLPPFSLVYPIFRDGDSSPNGIWNRMNL